MTVDTSAGDEFAARLREALTKAATASTIAAPATHRTLLQMIAETAAGVISARAGALFLVDEETQELRFEVALGERAEALRGVRLPLGHGIAGGVALSGQPMAVSDVQADERWAAEIGERVGYIPESILCVPLFYEDAVIGVLELLDKEGAPSFGEEDILTLSLFANQAAVAIEQSRVQQSAGALVASVLRSLVEGEAGLDADENVQEDVRRLGASIEEDELFRRSLKLADLVQEIGRAGERELDACEAILESFAAYLRARSSTL
ncbi:MAG: GAF domain-containing protein [Actinobacteria bacterium]|nr:MAG: GAF domain-containing protein [Actinomycetota bacterium]